MPSRDDDPLARGPHTNIAKFVGVKNYGFMVGQFYAGDKHPMHWLSRLDFSEYPQSHIRSKVGGTCEWFLVSKEFNDWIEAERKPLWCPGNAGAGKTFIASVVVDHLQRNQPVDKVKIVYFYFEQNDKDRQMHSEVFGNLLLQLVTTTPEENYSEGVKTMLQTYNKQQTYPAFGTLVDAIKSQAAEYQKVFIILDALDESPGLQGDSDSDVWSKMGEGIRNLCESEKIHIMVTSRSHVTFNVSTSLFKDIEFLKLEISAHEEDISSYARHKVRRSTHFQELVTVKPSEEDSEDDGPDCEDGDTDNTSLEDSDDDSVSLDDNEIKKNSISLEDQVVEAITNAADGIFLLATLHVKAVVSCTNIDEVNGLLKELPKDIDEAYDNIMKRIETRRKNEATLANQILPWVCCALRPMTMDELQHALATNLPNWKYQEGKVSPHSVMLSVCEGFIIRAPHNDKEVRFLHSTAQDYMAKRLSDYPDIYPDIRTRISGSCVGYLLYNRIKKKLPCDSDKLLERRLKSNPFLFYAACNWGYHLQQYERELSDNAAVLSDQNNPINLALKMLKNDNLLLNLSQITSIPVFKQSNYSMQFPRQVTGLHFAARFGTEKLLQKLIDSLGQQDLHIDALDSYQKTALHIAARQGHSGICKILLSKAADIEATTGDGETPLLGAAMNGDLGAVKLLLEHKADVKMRNKPGGTALHWASLNGNPDVVAQLLDCGADIAAVADAKATVDYGIASVGFDAMVWLLLDKLASAGLKNLLGGTALHWAAFNGHHRVVELLLERKADVNAKNLMGGTSLHAASWNGNEKAVKALLKNGALVSEKTALGNTALREAGLNGNKTVARILLDYGADAAGEGDLAEGLADFGNNYQVAARLAVNGVKIEATDKKEGERVLDQVVKLVAHGNEWAEIMMREMLQKAIDRRDDAKGWSALREVTARGLEALTQLLQSIKKTPSH